jgi:hypothetical protein
MKSLFEHHPTEGIMVFTEKENWKNTLLLIRNILGNETFFFFFDADRGSHLKVFSTHFEEKSIQQIQAFLQIIPATRNPQLPEDILFKNAPENSIQRILMIPKASDILYKERISEVDFKHFLGQLCHIVIDALAYNDFFIPEKNRINFAIQLLFMALVRTDKNLINRNLSAFFGNNEIENNSPLSDFYREVQQIESEEEIEEWVLSWLGISEQFLKENSFQILVESVCTVLEIKSFSTQLMMMVYVVLQEK